MFIPTTSPARVAVRRPIEALQRVAARIWPPKADDDFPSPRSPEDASDLPTGQNSVLDCLKSVTHVLG